jgi:hypothetical protein
MKGTTTMSLIPDLSDIPELGPVTEGTYDLRIQRAKLITAGSGRKGIFLPMEVVGEEGAEDLLHTLWLPMESDDPSKAATMWRMIKEFLTAVGMPTDGLDEDSLSDFVDLELNALVGMDHYDGKDKNVIKRVL